MPRSKRLVPPGRTNYCRKCMKSLPENKFYNATDYFIDANGLFSVCIDCVNDIYQAFLSTEHSVKVAVHRVCRLLNIAYVPEAVDTATAQYNTLLAKGNTRDSFFGIYKAKALLHTRKGFKDSDVDMTYKDVFVENTDRETLTDDHVSNAEELKRFWGTDDKDDIEFLEREMSNFKRTHKADTYAEIVLLREVCYKNLEINRARREGRPVDSYLKALQEVMKNLAISPNITNSATAGRTMDSFGSWIKEIEQTTPAEWVADKSIYGDVDNLEEYTQKYIVSPIRSFVTGNREFDITSSESSDDGSDDENE